MLVSDFEVPPYRGEKNRWVELTLHLAWVVRHRASVVRPAKFVRDTCTLLGLPLSLHAMPGTESWLPGVVLGRLFGIEPKKLVSTTWGPLVRGEVRC